MQGREGARLSLLTTVRLGLLLLPRPRLLLLPRLRLRLQLRLRLRLADSAHHNTPAAPCLLFSMHEGYAPRHITGIGDADTEDTPLYNVRVTSATGIVHNYLEIPARKLRIVPLSPGNATNPLLQNSSLTKNFDDCHVLLGRCPERERWCSLAPAP